MVFCVCQVGFSVDVMEREVLSWGVVTCESRADVIRSGWILRSKSCYNEYEYLILFWFL